MSANSVFRLCACGGRLLQPGKVIGSNETVEQDAQGETGTGLECTLVLQEKGWKELAPPQELNLGPAGSQRKKLP